MRNCFLPSCPQCCSKMASQHSAVLEEHILQCEVAGHRRFGNRLEVPCDTLSLAGDSWSKHWNHNGDACIEYAWASNIVSSPAPSSKVINSINRHYFCISIANCNLALEAGSYQQICGQNLPMYMCWSLQFMQLTISSRLRLSLSWTPPSRLYLQALAQDLHQIYWRVCTE